MIKLLAVDMDGTCLNSNNEITDETLEALKKASQSGILVVPTTGRNFNCLPEKIKTESFYKYVICSNGAVALDIENKKEIYKAFISIETATDLLRKFKKYFVLTAANINNECYAQGKILCHFMKKFFKNDAPTLKCVSSLLKETKKDNTNIEKFQLFYFTSMQSKKVKKTIEDHSELSVIHTNRYCEFSSKKATKGDALLALAEYLGISANEIACIGDEQNDVSMFKVAGLSFAMGNAKDNIKSLATHILPTNDENGVAEGLNKYVLT